MTEQREKHATGYVFTFSKSGTVKQVALFPCGIGEGELGIIVDPYPSEAVLAKMLRLAAVSLEGAPPIRKCPIHHTPMRRFANRSTGEVYYGHRTPDGSHCTWSPDDLDYAEDANA